MGGSQILRARELPVLEPAQLNVFASFVTNMIHTQKSCTFVTTMGLKALPFS